MLTTNTIEYQNALNFLQAGCECGCSDQLPHEKFAQFRSDFQNLPKLAQDASLMTYLTFLQGGKRTTSPRLKNKDRTNQRTVYRWNDETPLCQETCLNMFGISRKYLENVKEHLQSKGFTTRTHSNTGRKPHWETKMNITQSIKKKVKNFLENYTETHGSPNPAGKTKRTDQPIIELPTDMSYSSVYRNFVSIQINSSDLKSMKYHTFYKLWKQLTPHIQFKTPRTDLCDACQKFRNDLHSCLDQVSEAELKKIFAQHKFRAELERGYYNQNKRLAKEKRELVTKNYIINHLLFYRKVKYCSVDATAHYSFDWAQNVHAPYSDQQASQDYFKSLWKIYLFGIQNEATGEQINYILEEDELLDKGSNGTLSLVFAGIMKLNRGEKHLKLTCDNAAGQNKNNTTIRFCQFLVLAGFYETVELNFMIAGHTKFKVDGNFGMIKKLYWKSKVNCLDDFAEVIKKSSPQGFNKVQCYENGQGFWCLDIKGSLEPYFTKLPSINKYHHFFFSAGNPNIVRVQEFANSDFKEFYLWKDKSRIVENIKEIRSLNFLILTPPSLKPNRQEYLVKLQAITGVIYLKNRPWLRKEVGDMVCSEPRHENYVETKYPLNSTQKYLDISKEFYINSEKEEKISSDRNFVSFLDLGLTANSVLHFQNQEWLINDKN